MILLEINAMRLVAICGGDWGNESSTDIGGIVKDYLYGDANRAFERRAALGDFLVQCLERKIAR